MQFQLQLANEIYESVYIDNDKVVSVLILN
jgi:hypothetical protein